jgi:hypothetical protein
VDSIQLPFANPDRDRLGAKSAAFDLITRHHTVLPRRDSRYVEIGGVAFCAHMDA